MEHFVGIDEAKDRLDVHLRPSGQSFAFARATGKLAKTDRLDAAAIAHFAEAIRPPVRPIADPEAQALGELVARRRQSLPRRRPGSSR
jgi:transposase